MPMINEAVRKGRWQVVNLFLLGLMGASCATVAPMVQGDGSDSTSPTVLESVRARRFALVDSEGHEVGSFGQADAGGNELRIDGGPQGCSLSLGARKEFAWVHVYPNRGKRRAISMTWTEGTGPDVTLYDENGTPRLSLMLSEGVAVGGDAGAVKVRILTYGADGNLKLDLADK